MALIINLINGVGWSCFRAGKVRGGGLCGEISFSFFFLFEKGEWVSTNVLLFLILFLTHESVIREKKK